MPFYKNIKVLKKAERIHLSKKLLELRSALNNSIPPKTVSDSLLLATWNIREFAEKNKGGERLLESYYYIAEIISKFDIVAVQEVRDDLGALNKLMEILGYKWSYIATDTVIGTAGNNERLAFIYNSSKVRFRGIAGEIVLSDTKALDGKQFARTPFTVHFQAGWFKFVITTVHIYYGTDTGVKLERRIKEIESIVDALDKRVKNDSENTYIVLGDFNIISPEHKTMEALKSKKFIVPDELQKKTSNYLKDKHYDQIAFKTSKGRLEFTKGDNSAGVFDYYDSVFNAEDFQHYKSIIPTKATTDEGKEKAYKEWKTYQMSDHLPMWIQLKIDFSDNYLEYLKSYTDK